MAERAENKMKFDYDQEADVLYCSFGTGEPSFSEEVDDHVVIDFGIYTGAPTGFQVLHVKEAGVPSVKVVLEKKLPELLSRKQESLRAVCFEREQLMKRAVEAFPKRANSLVHAQFQR